MFIVIDLYLRGSDPQMFKMKNDHFILFNGMGMAHLDRFIYLASVRRKEEVLHFLVTAWLVWRWRNMLIHGKDVLCFFDLWIQAGNFV